MNLRHLTLNTALLLAAVPCFVGCDAQTDPTYGGEPLATLRGTVTSSLDDPPQVSASILWDVWVTQGDTVTGVEVPVDGSFPASFTLELLAPPPSSALNPAPPGSNESNVGTAYIGAMLPGTSAVDVQEEDLVGISADHVLVYVDSDIQPGTYWEEFLHGQLQAGYHLMYAPRPTPAEKVEIAACFEQAKDDCNACGGSCEACDLDCKADFRGLFLTPGGFGDEVTVNLGPGNDLEVPEFH